MKVRSARLRAALAGAAVLVPLCAARGHAQASPIPRDQSDAEAQSFRSDMLRQANNTLNAWREAWAGDNVNALMRLYDQKAMVQFPGDPQTRRGLAGVETALKAHLPAAGNIQLALQDAEVSGNLMYVYQTFVLEPSPEDTSSSATVLSGTTTMVLMKERGGWKIRAQIFIPAPDQVSSTAQAPAAQEAAAAGNNDD